MHFLMHSDSQHQNERKFCLFSFTQMILLLKMHMKHIQRGKMKCAMHVNKCVFYFIEKKNSVEEETTKIKKKHSYGQNKNCAGQTYMACVF